jgi:hypothetical protein
MPLKRDDFQEPLKISCKWMEIKEGTALSWYVMASSDIELISN